MISRLDAAPLPRRGRGRNGTGTGGHISDPEETRRPPATGYVKRRRRRMTDRIASLSPRQLQCLRLVARGWEAKDIGRELGISDLTVKNHLSAARTALGVARSIDAARLVEAAEAGAASTSAPPGIPDRAYSDVQAPGQSGREDAGGLRDAGYMLRGSEPPIVPLPFPTRRGQRNELGLGARLALVVILTVLLIAAVGFFVEAGRGLNF